MRALLFSCNQRAGRFLLIVIQGIEQGQEEVVEWESLATVSRPIRISAIIEFGTYVFVDKNGLLFVKFSFVQDFVFVKWFMRFVGVVIHISILGHIYAAFKKACLWCYPVVW